MSASHLFMAQTALCFSLLLTAPALAAAPVDLSGTYPTSKSEQFDILEGDGRLLLQFDAVFGPAAHTCGCLIEGRAKGSGTYIFTNEPGSLTLKNGKVRVSFTGEPSCCGAGFGGLPAVPLSARTPPQQCTVTSTRAVFHNLEGVAGRAYVVKGDTVQVTPAGMMMEDFVVARFLGRKKTLGLLKRADLACKPSPDAGK